jgi:hypothetical protein
MPFTLPFHEPITAMIDVRSGGDPAAQAIAARLAEASDVLAVGLAVYAGIDDDKVLTYAQWADERAAGVGMAAIRAQLDAVHAESRWAARLYSLASSANRGPIDLAGDAAAIAHTGLFAMNDAEALAPFLALAKDAAEIAVAHAPSLLTANFHASHDCLRAVNLGFWANEQGFRDLAANPPFRNRYWDGLADNEAGFFRRLWVEV